MGRVRFAARVLSVVSAALWPLLAAAAWQDMNRGVLIVGAAAVTVATVLAGLCWVACAVRDRDKDALIEGMAALTMRRATRETRTDLRRVS